MQILRFEDAPEVAPKRKKSSAGWIGLGLVAALFGVSTAFASSSITINSDDKVNLGQGVVTVSGCDTNIGFKPATKLSSDASSFQVTDFIIGYDWSASNDDGLIDTTACDLKQMKITLYKDISGEVQIVPCQATYGAVPSPLTSVGGNSLKGSLVGIGKDGTLDGNFAEYVTDYKCSSDGSFYFLMDKSRANQSGSTMRIHWTNQIGFIFNANIFDHVTIESVSGETGLTGV